MRHRAVTILHIVVWIFASGRLSEACSETSETYQLIVRSNSSFTVSCLNRTFNNLDVLWWGTHFITECKPNPNIAKDPIFLNNYVSISGGCSSDGVNVNVTLGPATMDTNSYVVYCNYVKDALCFSDYFSMAVYNPGSLQLVTTTQNASGVPVRSVSHESDQTSDSANQLRVRVDAALQSGKTEFSFTCSFTQCGNTHEAQYSWIITSDSAVPTGNLTTWASNSDKQSCEFSTMIDVDENNTQLTIQKSGIYPSQSFASWNAASFLAAVCSNPAARSFKVRVGCTVQFKVFTNATEFTWSNDARDAAWQTIVFECPSSESPEKGLLGMSQVQLIGVGVGLVVALVVIIIVTCIIVRARCSRNAHEAVAQEDQAQQNTIGVSNNSQFGKKVSYEA